MPVERRAFNSLPEWARTPQNDREYSIADDVLYEPERADFLTGYIGETDLLTQEDLARTPRIVEDSPARQKYQLSIGAVFIDPETQEFQGGAFYNDLLGQIGANGGLTQDQNRLFSTAFYAWTPPIDYDKHINFGRYFWTGVGSADVNGEYVTMEPAGSQVVVYRFDGTIWNRVGVEIVNGLPAVGPVDQVVEDASDPNRPLFISDGVAWNGLVFGTVDDLPTDNTGFSTGDYLYVARTGPDWNRIIMWVYSEPAGRWVAQPVVISLATPDRPVEGMIWENSQVNPTRPLQRFTNGGWVTFTWTPAAGPSGIGQDGDYVMDMRSLSQVDTWARENWWRHHGDLSPVDREALLFEDQGVRPIVEFWSGIEHIAGDQRDFRNDAPVFTTYAYRFATDDIVQINDTNFPGLQAGFLGTTIMEYVRGTGQDDFVLGFPITFNESGELLFGLTLETDTIQANGQDILGYRYFRDTITGLVHSIWSKSEVPLTQSIDQDGLYEVPRSVSSNPNHEVLTSFSRSRLLLHMTSVIEAQVNFSGDRFGINTWRWTRKAPTLGATIIDPEQTLLRALGLLQRQNLNLPDVIRQTAKEYNKTLFRFVNRLNQFWDRLDLNDPAGTLLVTPGEAVDAILTDLMIGRTDDFPYFYADMGTYLETRINQAVVSVVDPDPKPIHIAPSGARVGASSTWVPETFTDRDGVSRLRGHDGVTIPSFGDDRDLVWLELQNRFLQEVPDYLRTETSAFSSRFDESNFFLQDYYNNTVPMTSIEPVDQVVQDYNLIVAPPANLRVFSQNQAQYATFDGVGSWFTRSAFVDDVFLNLDDNEYYTWNGFRANQIDRWNRTVQHEYTTEEFQLIYRREYERWALFQELEFVQNVEFDINDKFTWNYRSAGVPGHYLGLYQRVYGTVRPHMHPWEILGYWIEPDWWRTQYVPTSTAPDGSPRYANTHPMWTDIQAGIINPISGATNPASAMSAPIPVDVNGDLLDPIAAGVVIEDNLDPARLNDSWIFGDGAPSEQEFYYSAFWPFTIALSGYLMKPGIWVDNLWSELYITLGQNGPNQLWRAPHVVHRDTLTRPGLQDLPTHLEVVNGQTEQRLGVNSWIAEIVLLNGSNPTNDFARIIQNTTPVLGWRTAGFINQQRTIIATLGGEEIPFEDLHVVLHQSAPVEEKFNSGMLILREDTGYRVFGFDPFRPFFRIELPAEPITGGQVELREEVIATEGQLVFDVPTVNLPGNSDTATFGVLIDGQRIKPQHVTVTGPHQFTLEGVIQLEGGETVVASVVTIQSNPSTRVKRFKVQGVDFPYFAAGSGRFVDIEYGRFFETSTDVINFMIGYGRYLESQGWVLDFKLEEGAETEDWLFGAKVFANWVLVTENVLADTGQIDPAKIETLFISPIRREAKLIAPTGQIQNVESVQNGVYGIVDQNVEPIPVDEIFTSRIGNTLTVQATGDRDIYGVRAYLNEVQHAVFFSNITKFNDLIYDPVIALWHKTLRVDSYRTLGWRGRLEADGSTQEPSL